MIIVNDQNKLWDFVHNSAPKLMLSFIQSEYVNAPRKGNCKFLDATDSMQHVIRGEMGEAD